MSEPMINFNLSAFLIAANELVRADEVARALDLLDNLPAYYRDHEPEEVTALREKILRKVSTPTSYANNDWDLHLGTEEVALMMQDSLRGSLITHDVKYCNQHGFTPHIVDMGPGEYWLPRLLKIKGLDFSYEPIYLHQKAYEIAKSIMPDVFRPRGNGPVIFIACEIIEHLWNEEDIKIEMLRNLKGEHADIIHISTPLYTFHWGCEDWDKTKDDLGHLRAYTPVEFQHTVNTMFPKYVSAFYNSQVMHLKLTRDNTHQALLDIATQNTAFL